MARKRTLSLRSVLSFGAQRHSLSPGPPSPTFSEATNASAMNLGANGPRKIITRANLKSSIQAYEDLVESCSTYRAALVAMSNATAAFADAMERCSGLKGPAYEAGTRLQAASGMHHLMGNLWHILSETLDKNVEKPLRQHLESYRTTVQDRSQDYEHALKEKSRIIHETETRNLNRKQRNLQSFREALSILQRQVDELDELKVQHYQDILDHEEEVWNTVQGKVCVAVRSTMDVFDRVTSKASDPIIEPMLQTVPDPFDSYGPPQSEDQIFSILAPLSIMSPSPSPSPVVGTPEAVDRLGSILPNSRAAPATLAHEYSHAKITSWLPSPSNGVHPIESTDWAIGSGSTSPTTPTSPEYRRSTSPNQMGPRRQSMPPPARAMNTKAESKLRSVTSYLPSIDESHHRQDTEKRSPEVDLNGRISPSGNPPPISYISDVNGNTHSRPFNSGTANNPPPPPPPLVNSTGIWDYNQSIHHHQTHEHEQHDQLEPGGGTETPFNVEHTNTTGGEMTPRLTTLFAPPMSDVNSPTTPPSSSERHDLIEPHEKDEDAHKAVYHASPT